MPSKFSYFSQATTQQIQSQRNRKRKWPGNLLTAALCGPSVACPASGTSSSSLSSGWSDHPSQESTRVMRGLCELDDVYSDDEEQCVDSSKQRKTDEQDDDTDPDDNAPPPLQALDRFKFTNNNTMTTKPSSAPQTDNNAEHTAISDQENTHIDIVYEAKSAPIPAQKHNNRVSKKAKSCYGIIDPRLKVDAHHVVPAHSNHNNRRNALSLPSLSDHQPPALDDSLRQQNREEREESVGRTPSVSPASVADAYVYQPPTIQPHHPFAAVPPAHIADVPVSYTSFDEALRQNGKFGRHVLKWRQIYYVMGHLAEVLSHGKIKVIAFDVSGQPTQTSKGKICPYWPECRACVLKQTHIACVIGTCGIFHSRYALEPSDKTWAAVQHRNANNKIMLELIKKNHEWLYNEVKKHLIWLLKHNPKYIDNVLVPIVRNTNDRKLCIHGTGETSYSQIRGHFGFDIEKHNAKQRERQLVLQCEKWLQELWSGPPVGLTKHTRIGIKACFFRSRCPKHKTDESKCCRLREDGRLTEPQWLLHWDSALFCVWNRYFCDTHKAVKISATHSELLYHYTERLTTPCFRFGNTHISTTCACTLPKVYKSNALTYKALREQMLTNYESKLDRDVIVKKKDCPFVPKIRRQALDRIVPNVQSLTQILQDIQLEIYPAANEKLDNLYFATTPLHFGIDQTFDELSNVTLEDGTKLNIGCGSIASDLEYWAKWFVVNDLAENYDQTAKYVAELKAKLMYYGDLSVLTEYGLTFSLDHLEKFQNLDTYIDHELKHNLEHNELYRPIAEKLNSHKVTIRDIPTRKGECSMHLNRRKYKYAGKDGVTSMNHRDFTLVSQSETTWANSLQHGDEILINYPRNDVMNVAGTRSDDYVQRHYGYLSATVIYWHHADQFQVVEVAKKYQHAIHAVLRLEGYTNLVERHRAQQKLIESADHQWALPVMREIAMSVHIDHVRQILGLFVTGSNEVDTEWIRHHKEFYDKRGRAFAVMSHATLHHVAVTYCKYFGRDVDAADYISIMQPHKDYIAMLYSIMKLTLQGKVYERDDVDTKPIMKYPNIRKAIMLAATPLSITGFVNNYNCDLSGVWVNVNNERIHCTAKFLEALKRRQKKAGRAVLNVEIKRYHTNTTVIDHLIRDIDGIFDEHFVHEFERIKDSVTSRYFKNVEERGICVNLSNKWRDHLKATTDLLNRRDINRSHKKVTTKLHRKLYHRDILLLQATDNKITVDVLAYLHASHSIHILCKELLRHGWIADTFDDGTLIIDPNNAGKIYAKIEDKQFNEIHIAPSTTTTEQMQAPHIDTMDLPQIPAYYQQPSQSQSSNTAQNEHSSTNQARRKRSDEEEMDESPSQSPNTIRVRQYEQIGDATDVDGVYRYQGRLVLHGAYQIDNYNAASKAVDFINQQVPYVTLNKFIIDDLNFRDMSKQEIVECFKDLSAMARLFGPYVSATNAKKVAKYMGNTANYERFKHFVGFSSIDVDPIEQYRQKHKTQLGVIPLGGNSLGNESLINPARRRREAASQKQDDIYLDASKRPKNKPKWKQQTIFYDDYENYAIPFVQWCEGCKCKRDDVHAAMKDGDHEFLSWPSANMIEDQALDEMSLFALHAMQTKQRKQLAVWHGYDASKYGNNVGAAVDYIVIHHIFGDDMNEMTEEDVMKKLDTFFDWNKPIWMKQGRKFRKKRLKGSRRSKK